jgi:hypothetical protein
MLIGITDDTERELGDTEVSPYKEMHLRKCLVHTVKHLIDEIHGRCNVYNWPCPSCRYWDKKKLVAWLKENPISYWKDRQWLIKGMGQPKLALVVAQPGSVRIQQMTNGAS